MCLTLRLGLVLRRGGAVDGVLRGGGGGGRGLGGLPLALLAFRRFGRLLASLHLFHFELRKVSELILV